MSMYRITKSDGYMAFHPDCLESIQIDYLSTEHVIIRIDNINSHMFVQLTMKEFYKFHNITRQIHLNKTDEGHLITLDSTDFYFKACLKIFQLKDQNIKFQICGVADIINLTLSRENFDIFYQAFGELLVYIDGLKAAEKWRKEHGTV